MQDLIGKTLGKYRIVAKLGSGGMAEVYKAFQPGLDRYVAIKVMHSHLSAEPDFVKRFQREALATGKLSHPNIVQALDFDEDAGIYFMVMQFIDGPTLKDEFKARLRQGHPFSLAEIARLYLAICDGIDYAHHRGMIHRDLKPANLMIDDAGQILITDFGIARLLEATQYTVTGAMTGTPAYMSPEQGQGLKVDHRSDIYTLGVILYELLTGQVPYQADTPIGTVMKHINEPLRPPRQANPAIPEAVEQVVLRAMAKQPADRFQSAGELSQALRAAVGLKPGDNLRRQPLRSVAPPRKLDGELDPTTGAFTPVGLGTFPRGPEATIPAQRSGETSPAPVIPPARRSVWPLLIGSGVFVVLILLGLIAFLAFQSVTPSGAEESTDSGVNTLAVVGLAATVDRPEDPAATVTANWLAADDDRDGLTNAEEQDLGTLPDRRDTDQDNIDDADEVNTHRTDPLKSDTDGDGLKDGFEISQGLDPLSPDTDADGLPDARDPNPNATSTPTVTHTPLPTPTPTATHTPLPTATPTPGPTAPPTSTPLPTDTPTSLPPTATPTPLDPTEERVAALIERNYPMGGDKTGLLVVNCHPRDTIEWYVEAPRNEYRLIAKVPPFKDGQCGISHVEGFFVVQTYQLAFTAKDMGTRRYIFANLPPTEIGTVYFRDGETELQGIRATFQYCPTCQ